MGRRGSARRGPNALAVFGGMVALAVSLPVTLPLVALDQARAEALKRRAARSTPCGRCGVILGDAALARSDALWLEAGSAWNAANSTLRRRIVRRVHAVCVACGQAHTFDRKARGFSAVET